MPPGAAVPPLPLSGGANRTRHVSIPQIRKQRINDGDIVIFHPEIKEGNGIYVIAIGNSLAIKRVDFNTPEAITLISANPAYEPRRFSGPELNDIRVAGRVVACYHRV